MESGRIDEGAKLNANLERQPLGPVSPYLRGLLDRSLGQIAAARGQRDGVEEHFPAGVAAFRELGYPYWVARTETDLAAWLADQGCSSEALPLLERSIGVFESLRAAPALGHTTELRERFADAAPLDRAIGA